jgi:hypothetical protein
MAYTINRRLAQLVDGNGQLNTGKIPNDYITSDHVADNTITAAMLHTSFTVSTSNLTSIDTDDVSEGSTNLYYTDARADARIAAATTDDLTEGSTNLYFTNARIDSHLSGGTGVTYSSGAIAIGQDVGTSATPTFGNITTTGYIAGPATFTIDPAAVGNNTGTVVIAGNLQVDGTTTTINSTTMTVDDLNLTLASGAANAAAANGAGITVDGASATIIYDGTNDEWDFNKDINVTGTATMDGLTVDGAIAVNTTSLTGIAINSTNNGSQISFESAVSSVPWYVGVSGDSTEDFVVYQSGTGSGAVRLYTDGDTRLNIANNGDISFYEDTGTTAKFFWDASEERLDLTGSDYQFGIKQGSNQPWYNRAVSDGSYRIHLNGTGDILTATSTGIDVTGTISAGVFTTTTNTGIFSNSIGSFPLVTSTPYDYVAKFESTDAGAAIIIEDSSSTNNGNRVSVNGDTMSFFTGASSALTLDASQNATFAGTINSGSVLNVNHSTTGTYPKASGIGLGATSTTYTVSSNGGTVSFNGGVGLYAENTAASGNPTNLVFWTNHAGTPAEAMRIDSLGNVGIGTDSPNSWASYTDNAATVLQVQDTSQRARIVINGGDGAHLDLIDYSGSTDDKHLNFVVDGGIGKFGSLNDAGNSFITNNILTMDLSNGSIGIGTNNVGNNSKLDIYNASMQIINTGATEGSTADASLHIKGAEPTQDRLTQLSAVGTSKKALNLIASTDSNDAAQWWSWGVDTDDEFKILHGIGFSDSNVGIRINSSGNVGIGTSSPAEKLHISGGNILLNNALEIRTKDTGGTIRTIMRANSSNELEYGWSANAPVKFMGGGSYTERMRIHTNGNVGIGVISPSWNLQVAGRALVADTTARLPFYVSRAGGGAVTNSATIVSGAVAYFNGNIAGSDALRIGAMDNGTGAYYIDVSNYNATAAYNLVLQPYLGNVGIGTDSPTGKLHVSGGRMGVIASNSYASWGHFRIANTSDAEISMAFINGATESDFLNDANPACAYKVVMGINPYGAGNRNFGIGNDTMADYHTIWTEAGHQLPRVNNTFDLGSASSGYRNIYTNDLNLSNMPPEGEDMEGNAYTREGNEVDGTNGSWTIQEGADDLFLINRRNGKKYKFNLTEVTD